MRQIMGAKKQQDSSFDFLSSGNKAKRATALDAGKLESALRRRRSASYIDAIRNLDAGNQMDARQQLQDVASAVAGEFGEFDFSAILEELKGIVSKCYLGEDYEVHTLDMGLSIIQHYRSWQAMPSYLEPARQLAAGGQYAFIEVYDTMLCAVSASGAVAIVKL